jgi:hypothetical protein
MGKIYCLFMIPFIPFIFTLDVLFGNLITGVNTSLIDKLKEHKDTFIFYWKI